MIRILRAWWSLLSGRTADDERERWHESTVQLRESLDSINDKTQELSGLDAARQALRQRARTAALSAALREASSGIKDVAENPCAPAKPPRGKGGKG